MEREVLESALKRWRKDSSIAAVLSTEGTPAVGKFQNFLSRVIRVTLKVVLGNGRLANRSVVIKDSQDVCPEASEIQKKYNVFQIETMVGKIFASSTVLSFTVLSPLFFEIVFFNLHI